MKQMPVWRHCMWNLSLSSDSKRLYKYIGGIILQMRQVITVKSIKLALYLISEVQIFDAGISQQGQLIIN